MAREYVAGMREWQASVTEWPSQLNEVTRLDKPLCWAILDYRDGADGTKACIREIGHDNGIHESTPPSRMSGDKEHLEVVSDSAADPGSTGDKQ